LGGSALVVEVGCPPLPSISYMKYWEAGVGERMVKEVNGGFKSFLLTAE